MQEGKNKTILVVLLATFFGLVSGIVGTMVARVNLLESAYNIPLFRDVTLDAGDQKSNLVIRSAKKVVIEEDDRLVEVANIVRGSMVEIHKKKTIKDGGNKLSLDDYYLSSESLADGFVVTSDGWIISNFLPDGLENASSSRDKGQSLFSSFVIITADGKVNDVERILSDDNIHYSFWRINRNDLSVRNFVLDKDIKNGQSVAVVDGRGLTALNHILSKSQIQKGELRSSDNYAKRIILDDAIPAEIKKSFLFDLDGSLIGLFDKNSEIYAVDNFVPVINAILQGKEIRRSEFGVSYLDLSLISAVSAKEEKNELSKDGALIIGDEKNPAIKKGSTAEKAGFKEGDIIISVNNININRDNDLAYVLSGFMHGDKVVISFWRAGKKESVEVVLVGGFVSDKK